MTEGVTNNFYKDYKRKIAESLLISQQQHVMDGNINSFRLSVIVVFSQRTLTIIANFSTIFSVFHFIT